MKATADVLVLAWGVGGAGLVMLATYLGHEHLAWVGFALMGLGIAIAYSVTIQNRAGIQSVGELDRWSDNPASRQTDITEKPSAK